ncbi:AraC family transcriptional regulator [Telmatospirillum sp.]|uniref:AraC family transcriptional regulator n=1 Tax=Telmatospirillum sp. TaxID=2079197 RepID=UPI00284D4369|nr:AraC family transcriptional regulator [Telmatospirillum sp.]MDR3439466.1 AraC family transcriptional regulator [Telmatospirillum sp.]
MKTQRFNREAPESTSGGVHLLASAIARFASADGKHATAIPGLFFHRRSSPSEPIHGFYEPVLAMVVQGAKQVFLAGETYHYDPAHYLVTSVDLPAVSRITEASPAVPYLCLTIALRSRDIADLMGEARLPVPTTAPTCSGVSVSSLTLPLVDAVARLLGLLETPDDIPILAPLIEREILYRLLMGDQGSRLRQIATANSRTNQIAKAIDWLKERYADPLRIEDVARHVNMSQSSLHHHFKAMTALSPLQYQKHLRLQEARRLMLTERIDAASAAHRVGYESPSQFSREYSRLFGNPPMRDILCLQDQSEGGVTISP